MLSQAVTLIESALPKHQQLAQNLLRLVCLIQVIPYARLRAFRAGKSTFIEALGMYLVKIT